MMPSDAVIDIRKDVIAPQPIGYRLVRLLARRRALMKELTALASLVPDSVLAGQSEEISR